ncbi:hypothetical protein AURDEDRAFT_127263 [Auricularia subglabra TFB-10046 SS5]|nr:hypothetical protein AURDEDRAFT_127263 [Auricularia subglabra TFB-10046 SS5]
MTSMLKWIGASQHRQRPHDQLRTNARIAEKLTEKGKAATCNRAEFAESNPEKSGRSSSQLESQAIHAAAEAIPGWGQKMARAWTGRGGGGSRWARNTGGVYASEYALHKLAYGAQDLGIMPSF